MKLNRYKNAIIIILWMIFSCSAMQYVEMVMEPDYWIKSFIKLGLFVVVPVCFIKLNSQMGFGQIIRPIKAKDMQLAMMIGIGCAVSIVLGFFVIRPFLDEVKIVALLGGGPGVSALNFIPVAVYIALVNSFIEEFFFRGFGYLVLRRYVGSIAATVFSAMSFSLYHIGIIEGWFNAVLFALAVFGLALVGALFNFLDHHKNSIFPGWVIHLLSNLAINLVGLILFGVIKLY